MDRDVVEVLGRQLSPVAEGGLDPARGNWKLETGNSNEVCIRRLKAPGPTSLRIISSALLRPGAEGNNCGRPPLAVAMCHTATWRAFSHSGCSLLAWADDDASQPVRRRRRKSLLIAVPGSPGNGKKTDVGWRDGGMAGSLLSGPVGILLIAVWSGGQARTPGSQAVPQPLACTGTSRRCVGPR